MSFQHTLLYITVDEELDKHFSLSTECVDRYLQTAAAHLVKLAGLLIRDQNTSVCLLLDLPPSSHQDPQPPRLPPARRSAQFVMPSHVFCPPSPPCFFHAKQTSREKGPEGFLVSLTLFRVMAHTAWGRPWPFISISCLISEQLPLTTEGIWRLGEDKAQREAVIGGKGRQEGWIWTKR